MLKDMLLTSQGIQSPGNILLSSVVILTSPGFRQKWKAKIINYRCFLISLHIVHISQHELRRWKKKITKKERKIFFITLLIR